MTTVRVVLALAAKHNWHSHQMDVNNVFLHGVLLEESYKKLPPGFQHLSSVASKFLPGTDLICRLKKSIYDLKQAPRVWNNKLVTALLQYGFIQVACDQNLFTF